MTIVARSHFTTSTHSRDTGRRTGEVLLAELDGRPKVALAYLTVNHDAAEFLQGLSEALGSGVVVLGCFAQGVCGLGRVREEGFGATTLLLGGDGLEVAAARASEISRDTFEKGRRMGRTLAAVGGEPRFAIVNYDPLCGADVDRLLEGLSEELACPLVGGAAGHSLSQAMTTETHTFFGTDVESGAAVAFAASGDFDLETAICHGCSPVGVELTVTRSSGCTLLELDGRSARDIWVETCGPGFASADATSALAIGVPAATGSGYFVRAAYSMDARSGGVTLGTHVPEGTRIMLHHRSVEEVLQGANRMGRDLASRLAGKRIRAVFGFECGARTRPFMGDEATLEENLALQRAIGAAEAWIGMIPWGELYPVGHRAMLHNYSYPLLVLAQ